MKIKYLLPALLLALPVSVTRAQGLKMLDDLSYYLRMDYSLGGTAPVGLPATIRRLDSYSLRPNFSIGIEAQKPLDDRWGIRTGLHFGNKGMIWPLFYAGAFFLVFNGIVTLALSRTEKKLDYFRV